MQALQMAEHGPENLLRQVGIAFLVGVGKIIAAGWRGGAQRHQQPTVQAQGIAHVVETDGMSKLRVDQTDQMTPWTEGARLFVHPSLPRQFGNQMRRNQIAKLSQNSKLAAAWSSRFIFFIPVEWQGKISASSFFLSLYGMAVKSI